MDTESMIKSLQKTIENTETRLMNELDSPDRDFSDRESMVGIFREISAKLEQLKEYEDLGLTVANIKEIDRLYSEQSKELIEYRKAEKEGLLLRLPCRFVDKVYVIYTGMTGKHPTVFSENFEYRHLENFGKSVFLTKSEAEEKLKELEGSK